MIEITFDLSEMLVKRAIRHFWIRQIGLHGFIIYGLCLMLLVYFIVIGAFNWFTLIVALVVVGACILYPASYIVHKRRSMQELQEFSPPTIMFNMNDEGLTSRSALGSSSLKWGTIKRIWRFHDMWLIFLSKRGGNFVVLPTSVLDAKASQFLLSKVQEHGGTISDRVL